MLEKTTILIPTFNRPAGLRRLLQHLASGPIASPVTVLDSSNAGNIAQNAETCREFSPRLHIVHRIYPESLHPYFKCDQGIQAVSTEFFLFCADDDFPVLSTIVACEKFLSDHSDYAVCQGFFLSILRYKDGFHLGEDSFNLGREESTPEERIWNQFQNYAHITYALRRTSVGQDVLTEMVRLVEASGTTNDFSDGGGMGEMCEAMLCLAQGKAKRLPLLHTIRNGYPTQEDGWKLSFIFSPVFSPRIGGFLRSVSEALRKATGRSPEDCEELFSRAFSLYFSSMLRSKAFIPENWKNTLPPFDEEKAHQELQNTVRHLSHPLPGEIPQIVALMEKFPLNVDYATPGYPIQGTRWDYLLSANSPAVQPKKKTVKSRVFMEISKGARKLGRQLQRAQNLCRKIQNRCTMS